MTIAVKVDSEIWTKVQDAFAIALGLEEDEVTPEARLIDDLPATLGQVGGCLGRALIPFRRLGPEGLGLFAEFPAQIRPGLWRQQHAQPHSQDGARQQADDEPGASSFVVVAIMTV